MAKVRVTYQVKRQNQSTWPMGSTTTVLDLYDVSREAARDYLLSRNPNWEDVRIVETKPY